jgi:hypothetical protein
MTEWQERECASLDIYILRMELTKVYKKNLGVVSAWVKY